MYRSILVPVDASPCSAAAAQHAYDLARHLCGTVTLLYVLEGSYAPGSRGFDEARANAQHRLACHAVGARRPPNLVVVESGERGAVAAVVEAIKEQRPDLDILGAHAGRSLARQVLDSVASTIATQITVPVKVVPLAVPSRFDRALLGERSRPTAKA